LFKVFSLEWQFCSKHGIESNSETPNIDQLWVIGLTAYDLRWSIRRSSTNSSAKSSWTITAKAKVNQFGIPLIIKEYILRFYIPMAQSCRLQVDQSSKNLLEHLSRFLFWQWSFFVDSLEKFSVSAILHEYKDLSLLTDNLINLCNIRVENTSLQLNLFFNAFKQLLVLFHCANFHSHYLSS
jgi:hypothetical protein